MSRSSAELGGIMTAFGDGVNTPPKGWMEGDGNGDRAIRSCEHVSPGLLRGCIRTHGQLSRWHPHIRALTTYRAFTSDGTSVPLPDDLETKPFLNTRPPGAVRKAAGR